MGLLTKGDRLLSWPETKQHVETVRRIGLRQFIAVYHRFKDRQGDPFKWGDELEFCLATLNTETCRAQLSLLGSTILPTVMEDKKYHAEWSPEYTQYMIEAMPDKPFGDPLSEVLLVEESMRLRWQQLRDVLKGTDSFPLTLSTFPRLGCPKFTSPSYDPRPDSVMQSHFFPDEVVVQPDTNPRFMAITENLTQRRQDRHIINVPIFKDTNTPNPFVEDLPPHLASLALPDHVYMDCIGFGPGCCSIQVTAQAPDMDQARYLYDQMIVLGPLLQALTAGSPIFRGYLCDVDCRWNVIAAAVDDRTPGERGIEPLQPGEVFLPKSRWSTAECFLASESYNDIYVPNEKAVFQQLVDGGVDELMAKHVSFLFIRDALVLYASHIDQDPDKDTDHLDNIMTSNWHSMRFKYPKPEIGAGWRVEVRTMDHQLTYPENAAIAVFVMLVMRMVMAFKPNFYIPLSKVEENMQISQKRDAFRKEKFYFQRSIFPTQDPSHAQSAHYVELELMDANTIFNGKGAFPGLLPLVRRYVDSVPGTDTATRTYIGKVLKFISMKATGELLTTATWIRQFVAAHPDYKHDSSVSDKVTFDLISRIRDFAEGRAHCPEVAGDFVL